MHSVGQNDSTTADEVPAPFTDVMHYGLPAQMIHDKKAACVIRGVKTRISLNYYYGEDEASICCAIKSNEGEGKGVETPPFLPQIFNKYPLGL